MIFEIGKEYDFSECWGGEEYSWRATVLAVEGTLLKLNKNGVEIIFNTASTSFSEAREFDLAKLEDLPDYLKPSSPPES